MLQEVIKWTALEGIDGRKIYCKMGEIVFFEELDVSGRKATNLHFIHNIRVTVCHPVEEILGLLKLDEENRDLAAKKLWKKLDKIDKARERARLEEQK